MPASVSDIHSEEGSRYEILAEIARGGMATVYVGRLRGAAGFTRLVAIKRAHPHIVHDARMRELLLEEARHASKLHHPNVVAVQDVELVGGQVQLVMDYVEGGSLAQLVHAANDAGHPLPPDVAIRIAVDACAGLQAAHELTDEFGAPWRLIHRDVSPHNVLVGTDGVARLTDFGIAKSIEGQLVASASEDLKGKIAYMAPEYIEGRPIDARVDVFALGVSLWEALANDRLFRAATAAETLKRILESAPRSLAHVAPAIDEVLRRALATDRNARYPSAVAFGTALRDAAEANRLLASADRVGQCVRDLLASELEERRRAIRARAEPSTITRRSRPRLREETLDDPTQAVPRLRPWPLLLGIFLLVSLALAVVYADMRPRPASLAVGLPEVAITPPPEVPPEVPPKAEVSATPEPEPPRVIDKPRVVPKPTPSASPTFDPNPY